MVKLDDYLGDDEDSIPAAGVSVVPKLRRRMARIARTNSEDCDNKWRSYERYEPDFVIIIYANELGVDLISCYLKVNREAHGT
eukprot:g34695.t1